MVISLLLLGIAMKSLPVGTAYSIWVGVGAVGTVILGIVLYGEPANAARLISVTLIIAGIIGSQACNTSLRKIFPVFSVLRQSEIPSVTPSFLS
jgi:quaternary ammonium compound-resistance protein SugE